MTTKLVNNYIEINVEKIKVPRKITIPLTIFQESHDNWNDIKKLQNSIDKDGPRSRYIQDDFVIDFPVFTNISSSLEKKLKWCCTQEILQCGYILLYNYLKKKHNHINMKQSLHKRYTIVDTSSKSMELHYCCDLYTYNKSSEIKIVGHLCQCIYINWDLDVEKINLKIKQF